MIIEPVLTEMEVVAFMMLAEGQATGDQQRMAMEWVMREAARVQDLAFVDGPNSERDTTFALGRQYVGYAIRKMLLPVTLERAKAADERQRGTK